jgi:hypothetical protein
MMGLRRLWTVAGACCLWASAGALALPLAGCSGSQSGKLANVASGEMPAKAKWDGVYYSELYGSLHLKASGSKVTGRWERPHKDRWGEVEGEASGDVLKFTWSEWNRGLVGPNAKKSGKGYFKYKRPEGANVDDVINGEIGQGEDEVGDPWEAVKQRNIPPHPEDIGGSGARDVGGGDWDSDSKEKGKPESPHSPD